MFPINVPNVLTVLRILAVPVIVVALLGETPNGDALAAAVFALAAFTDGLDGYIARRRDDITTFGKLMDPLADKLLIVAALVSLVSLDRLAAWVAMVIIARELAVTGLRAVAAERGVVISASWLGKLKTALQVAAVFALIIWDPAPLAALVGAGLLEPLAHREVVARVLAGVDLGADLAQEAGALGDDVVAVDRLQVLLAGADEAALLERRVCLDDAADHLAHAILDEARVRVRLLHHGHLVRALHQLVDLGAHRLLDYAEQVRRVDVDGRALRATDVEGADAALVVGGDRDGFQHVVDLLGGEPLGGEPLAGAVGDESLRARAGGHPLRLDAGQGARSALRSDRGAEEGVELLGGDAGGGRRDGLRVAGGDRYLGAHPLLALANVGGDVRGEDLGLEGLAEHDLVDRLVEDLLEAGHVDAGLLRIEVDEALELGVVELLLGVDSDAQDLLHTCDPYPREAELGARAPGLGVGSCGGDDLGDLAHPLRC